MTVWPVIVRELRAQARWWDTYWLRVAGAAALLGASLWTVDCYAFHYQQGGIIFSQMHAALFLGIWVLVPLMTADCISRERREGTLGLLFLTPLRARDIVLAKGMVHALRALTLVLAGLPILAIPILLGGVSGTQLTLTAMIDFSALALALAAGLLASAWSKSLPRAQVAAVLLAVLFLGLFAFGHLVWWSATVVPRLFFSPWSMSWGKALMEEGPNILFIPLTNCRSFSEWTSFLPAAALLAWAKMDGLILLVSLFLLGISVLLASLRVKRSWRESPPSPLQFQMEQTFCAPRFWRSLLRSRMRRALERNPIGWLEQYSVGARLRKWGWCLVVILVAVPPSNVGRWRDHVGWAELVLLAGLGLSAAGSFRRERASGAFELLLVAPLSVAQIIQGRVRGLWRQFLPALVVLLLVAWECSRCGSGPYRSFSHEDTCWFFRVFCVLLGAWLALPVIGLYFSMRQMHLLPAWLLTCLTSFLFPLASAQLLQMAVPHSDESDWILCYLFCLVFAAFGLTGFTALPANSGKAVLWSCLFMIAFIVAAQILFSVWEIGLGLGVLLGLQLLLRSVFGWRLRNCLEKRDFAFH